jgi:hypothetical protein
MDGYMTKEAIADHPGASMSSGTNFEHSLMGVSSGCSGRLCIAWPTIVLEQGAAAFELVTERG